MANIDNPIEGKSSCPSNRLCLSKALIVEYVIVLLIGVTVLFFIFKGSICPKLPTPAPMPVVPTNEPYPSLTEESRDMQNLLKQNDKTTITGNLPEGWKLGINEDKRDFEYAGISSFSIYNQDGEKLFNAGVAEGIGGSDFCYEIFKFKDTSDSYIEYIKKNNATILVNEKEKVVDLSNEKYQEFTILGQRVRKVDNNLYFDGSSQYGDSQKNFDPTCGEISATMTLLPQSCVLLPKYENVPIEDNNYFGLEFNKEITDTDMTKLLEVLSSLRVDIK